MVFFSFSIPFSTHYNWSSLHKQQQLLVKQLLLQVPVPQLEETHRFWSPVAWFWSSYFRVRGNCLHTSCSGVCLCTNKNEALNLAGGGWDLVALIAVWVSIYLVYEVKRSLVLMAPIWVTIIFIFSRERRERRVSLRLDKCYSAANLTAWHLQC